VSAVPLEATGPSGDDRAAIVIDEVQRVLNVRDVTPDTPIDAVGADSQALLRLTAALEETFDVSIDIVDMFTARSVADLVDLTTGPAS
jgi:acyl carrier protein